MARRRLGGVLRSRPRARRREQAPCRLFARTVGRRRLAAELAAAGATCRRWGMDAARLCGVVVVGPLPASFGSRPRNAADRVSRLAAARRARRLARRLGEGERGEPARGGRGSLAIAGEIAGPPCGPGEG